MLFKEWCVLGEAQCLWSRPFSNLLQVCFDPVLAVTRGNDESLFSSETTPLVLAAQRNRYQVVSHLVSQGTKLRLTWMK